MSFRARSYIAVLSTFVMLGLGFSAAASANNPAMTVEPAVGLDFGSQELGFFGLAQSIGIRSAGDSHLEVKSVRLTGPDAQDFYIESNTPCPAILEPSSSCSVPVQFSPITLGEKNAVLEIESNAIGGLITRPLTGTATPSTLPPPPTPAPRASFVRKPKARIMVGRKQMGRFKVTFRSNQSGSTFQCRLDRKVFAACRSPKVFSKVKPGKHTISLRALTARGRTGPVTVTRFIVVRRR